MTTTKTNGEPARLLAIDVRDWRGLHSFQATIPEDGALVSAGNGQGKTSLLSAVIAACSGRDCGPDDVHTGADRATVTLETSRFSIRRVVKASGGSSVSVTTPEGLSPKKPQEWLASNLGDPSAFDPSRFLALDPVAQAKQAGEAFPCTLTAEHLARWGITSKHDLSGHGLAALERIRDEIYEQRRQANAQATEARRRADEASQEAERLAAQAPEGAPAAKDAEAGVAQAQRALDALQAQAAEATKAEARGAKTRERIATLKRQAAEQRRLAESYTPGADESAPLAARIAELEARAVDLRDSLARVEAELGKAMAKKEALDKEARHAAGLRTEAESLEEQAAQLDETLAATSVQPPAPEELKAATLALELARAAKVGADKAAVYRGALTVAGKATTAASVATEQAERLDALVKRLTTEAPAELVAESAVMPGLGITARGITLDGVPFAKCSTSQRVAFAVRLACIAAPRAGWILCDDLGHFDEEHQDALVRAVLDAGRQFLGAVVRTSKLVISPLAQAAATDAGEVESC